MGHHLNLTADDDSVLGAPDLQRFELSELAGAGEGRWSDAIYARYWAQKRQSLGEYDQSDWLSTERQEYGVEPDDEEPE
jgi:hypothetical protein